MGFPRQTVGFENPGEIVANQVIILGSGNSGLFVYNGSPHFGNPPVEWVTAPGVTQDPFGNVLPVSTGGFVSSSGPVNTRLAQLVSGGLALYAGGSQLGQLTLDSPNGPMRLAAPGGSNGIYLGSASNESDGIVLVPPSGDPTGATDSAVIAANLAETGAVMLLPAMTATYWINQPILMPQGGWLAGMGYGSVVRAASGFSGAAMVELAAGTVGQTTLRDLQLFSNVAGVAGVLYDNTGYIGATPDSGHLLQDIWVTDAQGDAFAFTGACRTNRFTRCHVVTATGYGFNAGCTDSIFTDCEAQDTALHGYYLTGSNNRFVGCKTFFAGYTGTFDGIHSGFYGAGCAFNTIVGCSAQQNALHGFDLQACSQTSIVGCEADTNNAGATTGCGINLNSNTGCQIIGNTGGNNTGLSTFPPGQVYGIQVAGVQGGTSIIGNFIGGNTDRFGFVSGGGYLRIDNEETDLSGVSAVKIGSVEWAPSPQLVLGNGATITWAEGQGSYWINPAANIINIILGTPIALGNGNDMVVIDVVNMSLFTITFAAGGNIAGGAFVIPANTAQKFIWGGNGAAGAGTSLWYPVS